MPNPRKQSKQGRYWILTIPEEDFQVPTSLPEPLTYIRGQLEKGEDSGFVHWQILVAFRQRVRVRGVKGVFGKRCHCELTRSDAARAYVWKDETSLGQRFEFGTFEVRRNSSTDWSAVWEHAVRGELDAIDPHIRVCHYNNLRRIYSDLAEPVGVVREIHVFWGDTGTGKSRDAWAAAGMDAYPKCPRTKFWDGYTNQKAVVIDEFRGGIDIGHLLRWFDRYPLFVEVKGASRPMLATKIYITSNICPSVWYPGLDEATYRAVRRRFTSVVHYSEGLKTFDDQ